MGEAWERRKGESGPAYAAFLAFRNLGPERTVRATAEYLRKNEDGLYRWTKPHDWFDRVLAWDRHNLRIEQEASDKALRKRTERWEKAREDRNERRMEAAGKLHDKAMKLLDHPDTRETTGDDGETVIEPAKWTLDTLPKLFKTADELAAAAILDSLSDSELDALDLDTMTLEEIREFRRRGGVAESARRNRSDA